jgi:hypothetical protein
VVLTYNGSPVLPDVAGTYRVQARVDEANYRGGAEGNLTVTGPLYEDWIDSKLPAGGDADSGMDPDRDGLANLIEYALGSDPAAYTGNPLLEVAGRRGPVVIKRQRALPGVVLTIEYSLDLKDWEEVSGEVIAVDADFEGVRISPAEPSRGKGFYRFRVVSAGG